MSTNFQDTADAGVRVTRPMGEFERVQLERLKSTLEDPTPLRARIVGNLLTRGWSRAEIAEAVGVTRQTVYNWEKEGKS